MPTQKSSTGNVDIEVQVTPAPDYSVDEIKFRGRLLTEMMDARNSRENAHDEFDGQTFSEYAESNRKLANAFITPKRNKQDTTYVTGTVRQKLTAILSLINNMSLTPEVMAFNQDLVQEVTLGQGIEDIIYKTDQLDNDDERKLARQYSLLEQGTVFVEECWYEKWIHEKELNKPFDGKNIDSIEWTNRKKKIDSLPTRNILVPENVFLGDITQPEMRRQPYVFTVEQIPYSEAESIYGNWKRWKHVSKDVTYLQQTPTESQYNRNFSITELKKNHVEVVKYQNRFKNEYAIFLNGVLMTPAGMPMIRKWGEEIEYSITSQLLWLISPHFAYGRSLGSIMKNKEALLNEFYRTAILKTQASFNPPRGNLTGQILSSRIFMPGTITNGLDPSKIPALGETQGMTKSEMAMIQEIQKGMEEDVPSGSLAGKNPIGVNRVTATQSNNIKTQADILTTLTVFACTMLEVKCGTLRMWNVLENWFEPIGVNVKDSVDGSKKYLENKYRSISIEKNIEGEGPGYSMVNVTKEQMTPLDIYRKEEKIKKQTGKPTRITNINPDIIKYAKMTWYVVVNPKQKKNSDLSKVLFSEMLTTALNFFGPKVQLDHMAERFAAVWGEDPTKMFGEAPEMTETPGMGQNGARGSIFPKSMTEAGKPRRPSVNTLENQ
jgi:hypothetical protein